MQKRNMKNYQLRDVKNNPAIQMNGSMLNGNHLGRMSQITYLMIFKALLVSRLLEIKIYWPALANWSQLLLALATFWKVTE